MNEVTLTKYAVRYVQVKVRCTTPGCMPLLTQSYYTTSLHSWMKYVNGTDRSGYQCKCGNKEFVEVTN